MRLRALVRWSLFGILTSWTTVYAFTSPRPTQSASAGAMAAKLPPSALVSDAPPRSPDAPAVPVSKSIGTTPMTMPVGAAPAGVVPAATRAVAAGPVAVDARLGHAQLDAAGARTSFVMVELSGVHRGVSQRPPTTTALVIDRSGSMRGRRLRGAVQAASAWVGRAAQGDRLSLTSFSDTARLDVPGGSVDANLRDRVLSGLDRMRAGGGTCLSCGLEDALSQLGRGDDNVRRVVVLSDGQANSGVVTPEGMRRLAADCRRRGVAVSTIGLGESYNERVLSALAFDSNGKHHFVATAADLPAVFEREQQHLATTVARGVEVSVELGEGVELLEVFDRGQQQRAGRLSFPIGSVASGETKTLLLRVRLPATPGERAVATVSTRYLDAASQQPVSDRRSLAVRVAGAPDSPLDPLVSMRVERSRTAGALEEASNQFRSGDGAGARRRLDDRLRELGATASQAKTRALARAEPRAAFIARDFEHQLADLRATRKRFEATKAHRSGGRRALRATEARRLSWGY
jgi:Ca-activated chloride channel family protein